MATASNAATAILQTEAHNSDLNIGLSASYSKEMSKTLSGILAETYKLTLTSHIYHWNVVGPLFKSFHELTEEHYQDLFEAADVIAERIRALGSLAPVTKTSLQAFVPDREEVSDLKTIDMINDLIAMHEAIVRTMRKAAAKAGDNDDVVTEDMLTARLTFHEKALWMLRSIAAK